jgi:outer membrane receptor protein involved in Fe transport
VGGDYFNDNAINRFEPGFQAGESHEVSYHNYAAFTEVVAKTRLVNITAGGRFDHHTQYGSALNPRLGLTKRFRKLHFKALYSHAFRAPGIENINYSLNGDITPERTRVGEIEAGYQISKNMLITANFFDITTLDPIVYYGISEEDQVYQNLGRTGTQGVEIEYRWKHQRGYINANYSYSTARNKETPFTYSVPGNEDFLLGFPAHRINLNSSFNINRNISVNPSVNIRGKRFGYATMEEVDGEEAPVLEQFDPVYLLNLFVRYNNFLTRGLSIGAGVFDILNERKHFIQPYRSLHAPLPGPAREIVFKVTYDFNFRRN